jgi:two-component system, chemotaxis family, sensor kinase CheA
VSDVLNFSDGMPSDEMGDYLQLYLDETGEHLDTLVETLLKLETDSRNPEQLNEAFRLIHSIKGSAGLMGLDRITVLTHRLENHFERLRSGLAQLDRPTMDLILRCIDFLRGCNEKLRKGEPLASAPDLLEALNLLQATTAKNTLEGSRYGLADEPAPKSVAPSSTPALPSPAAAAPSAPSAATKAKPASLVDYLIVIQFESGLALVDLKAELAISRLEDIAKLHDTLPNREKLESLNDGRPLQILLSAESSPEEIRQELRIDGISEIEILADVRSFRTSPEPTGVVAIPTPAPAAVPEPVAPVKLVASVPEPEPTVAEPHPQTSVSEPVAAGTKEEIDEVAVATNTAADPDAKTKVTETVRVDIERLDGLMNLAGELVVNKARFVQIARQMSPAFRKSSVAARTRNFAEMMRAAMQRMRSHFSERQDEESVRWLENAHEYEAELEAIEEQSRLWDESRRGFGQITEAIDQLTRVSNSLQRGVLETRMVPVAPLFNRFKRVVRDIANELNKKVHLEIQGEKTELDKRMIDELGDPLVHLIRNAIDHGLETPELRKQRGKPEVGTLKLEAAHSGNNVFIRVRDDGGGINCEKIRDRLVSRGILSQTAAESLSDRDAAEYIWHPGFSTAEKVSDISGRGVGMDIVKTRIAELNGTIDIDSKLGIGTTFTVRLPLTLAIIRSLLFRVRHGIFAVPLDNVREIVSVPLNQIITIHGRRTFEVRNEFVPLMNIEEIFDWHTMEYQYRTKKNPVPETESKRVNVVLLQNASRIMGLKVDELHGGQDIVIKSLAENFVAIRGLSGASILGDGSVCLLLDVGATMEMRSR